MAATAAPSVGASGGAVVPAPADADFEDRYLLLVDLMPDGVVVHQGGRIVYANASTARLLATTPEAMIGRIITDYVAPESRATLLERVATLKVPGIPSEPTRVKLLPDDGAYRIIESVSVMTTWKGRPAMQAIMRDLTQHLVAEAGRREAEERFTTVFQSLETGLIIVDQEGVIQSVNPAGSSLLEADVANLVGRSMTQLPVFNEDGSATHVFDVALADAMPAGEPGQPGPDLPPRVIGHNRLDGSCGWLSMSIRQLPSHGTSPTAVISLTDVTERRTAVEKLSHAAHHDSLTGLPNRTLMLDQLRLALRAAAELGERVAVLFVDLDNFKLINDSVGHDVGDATLRKVAQRILAKVRRTDVVSRLGGDEFVVVAMIKEFDEGVELADRLLAALAKPLTGRLRGLPSHASIGLVVAEPGEKRAPADLIRDADAAMYQAKAHGRNRVQVFDDSLHATVQRRVQLETDLREAVRRNVLRVAYQPSVNLATGRWSKAEALVRWLHPKLGPINPLEFIGIAEQSDLIHAIGSFVLDTACRDVKIMRARGVSELKVSVNLSVRQLDDPGLLRLVHDTLRRHQLPASALCLEVTESSLAADEHGANEVLNALRELGVTLSIDDFGTGYSSLARLLTLPVSELKIDRSFITDIPGDAPSVLVVTGIITLAHALGLHVVAEGAETAEHVACLKELGCDYIQGYYFARPMPLDEYLAHDKASA